MDENLTTLERLLDEMGAEGVARALAEICREKADHLRTNWQDEEAARGWESDANQFDGLCLIN